jgi:hypothetical protein
LCSPPTQPASTLATVDPTVAAWLLAAPAAPGWVPSNQVAPVLLPQQLLGPTAAERAPASVWSPGPTVADAGRAAAHGTPSTVLDRVFADLDGSLLADALQESWTPGATA